MCKKTKKHKIPTETRGSSTGSDLNHESQNHENFFDRLRLMREKLEYSQKKLGELVGVSSNTIQSWEKDTYPKGNDLALLSKILNCSIDWLLRGDTSTANDSNISEPPTQHDSVIELEHSNLIKRFKNKAFAKDLSEYLIDLESINEEAFREVGSYIRGLVQGLKLAGEPGGGPDRRKHQRRQQNDSEKAPDGVDRRSGNDRRQTGT